MDFPCFLFVLSKNIHLTIASLDESSYYKDWTDMGTVRTFHSDLHLTVEKRKLEEDFRG